MGVVMIFVYGKRFRYAPSFNKLKFQVDPRVVSTRNPSLIWSAGLQSLNGNTLKNHATISVEEDIITWESSQDKCTFTRGNSPDGNGNNKITETSETSPPCTRCWMQSAASSPAVAVSSASVTTKIDIISASSESYNSINAEGLYSQSLHSLNGTPYIIKRRPLIITKPHLQNQIEAANTQTSNCHQLITSSRQTVSSDLQRPSRKATVLQRTTSTPNLSKLTKAKVLRSTSKVDIKGM